MFVRFLPLVVALTPIVAANLAFVIGVTYGTLPACIPYIDGCVSISATGRTAPGSFLFRAVHLPHAAILAATWYWTWLWIKAFAPDRHQAKAAAALALGLIASVALVVYVTFLGTKEPIYEFMRRGGIYFYFAGVVFAQITLTTVIRTEARERNDAILLRFGHGMFAFCLAPLALGVVNLGQKALLDKAASDPIENSIEWTAALLMQAWFLLLYRVWRHTGLDIRVTVATNPQAYVTRRTNRRSLPHRRAR